MIVNQIIAIAFGIVLAWHDAPAVSSFERNDAPGPWMARFHRYNNWVKAMFCLGSAWAYWPDWYTAVFCGLLCAGWVYFVFDPILAVSREPARNWYYKGLNDKDGRFWRRIGGEKAGIAKAIVLLLLIAALNFTYNHFCHDFVHSRFAG